MARSVTTSASPICSICVTESPTNSIYNTEFIYLCTTIHQFTVHVQVIEHWSYIHACAALCGHNVPVPALSLCSTL